MEHCELGSLSVSVVGLGCNNFGRRIDATATTRVVDAALDAGIDFFDTADSYGGGLSEELLGKALGDRRPRVVLATKFGRPGNEFDGLKRGSAASIKTAVERSLRRLGTDYVDYYQMHFPDPEVPIEETLQAMHDLVTAGTVREIGCSNFGSRLLREASQTSSKKRLAPFRAVQNRYSIITRDPEEKVIPTCRDLGLGLIPYYPLESGLLTGKYEKGQHFPDGTRLSGMTEAERKRFLYEGVFDRIERLRAFAEERGHSLLELAMSWLVANPTVVSVISGATRPEQVVANVLASEWKMTPEERSAVDAVTS